MRIPRTRLVGGTAPNMHLSWRQHALCIGRNGVKFGFMRFPWLAVQHISVGTSAPLVHTFFFKYRELNITVRTNIGTYRFLSTARIPPQRLRGLIEHYSGQPS